MVRGMQPNFSDDEFQELKEVKGDRTWEEAILEEFGVRDGDRDES